MNPPIICYGCGNSGHGISSCQKIEKLIQAGVVICQPNKRIALKDGSPINHIGGETIIKAIEQMVSSTPQSSKSHFFTVKDYSNYETESEEEDVDVYLIPGIDYEYDSDSDVGKVLEVQRNKRPVTKARREVLDGVHIPKVRFKGNKENINPGAKLPPIPSSKVKAGPLSMQRRSQASAPIPVPVETRKHQDPKPSTPIRQLDPIPFDINKKRRVPSIDQDVEMEDVEKKKKLSKKKHREDIYTPPKPNELQPQPKSFKRQSELSATLGENKVVEQVLNNPITLSVGEVLASSKEVAERLVRMLKQKNVTPPLVAAAFKGKNRCPLIVI
jgi:hypothetical protein